MDKYNSTSDKYRKGSQRDDDLSDKEFYTGGDVKEGDALPTGITLLTSITE